MMKINRQNQQQVELFISFCFSAQISKNRVDQYPTALIKTPGGEIQIKCNHSNSDFNMIQWYKQSPGKTDMVLLGYARFSSPVVEDEFRGIYDVTGSGSSLSSFRILKLRQSVDNAVYFCAASRAQCCTNPPS
uniref:Immunoglobulin V-set domain-containing protein n=1 Tax=Amphiprion percula TaxID=161767 RepID=A0A3P8SAW3_AMPPE